MDILRFQLRLRLLQLYRWHKISDSYFILFLKYFHGSQVCIIIIIIIIIINNNNSSSSSSSSSTTALSELGLPCMYFLVYNDKPLFGANWL